MGKDSTSEKLYDYCLEVGNVETLTAYLRVETWKSTTATSVVSCGFSRTEALMIKVFMFKKCKRLEGLQRERANENWDYLRSIGIRERKLPSVVVKCPKILTLHLDEKLVPMVQCLATLGTKPGEVASAITKFPHILSHSIDKKLCLLLAFFQALGVPEKQLGKMLLLNPRIISYSIESKLSQIVDFLARPQATATLEFLKSIGLTELDLQKVTVNFPEILCRDVNKILKPNFTYLRRCGFEGGQIAALVTGYPPILIKSINNSLEPRMRFLVEVMGRRIEEVADYTHFFRHGFKEIGVEAKTSETKEYIKNIYCSLSEMLECNQKKFLLKFGLIEQFAKGRQQTLPQSHASTTSTVMVLLLLGIG
ncbi:hypothetical protein U1Q18_034572 [Sarracenia purpurea var. burkii]